MVVVFLRVVLLLLFPAVVEHAGEKPIEKESNHGANADGDDHGATQAVGTVFEVVAEIVSQGLIGGALA